MEKKTPVDIDEYIAGFPPDVQAKLQKIRATIRAAAPEAEETIKYKMPAYVLNGNLVYFAAYKRYISLYPAPAGNEAFNRELAAYQVEKSTIRFPLDKPIPYDLISQIVRYRVEANLKKAQAKKGTKAVNRIDGAP